MTERTVVMAFVLYPTFAVFVKLAERGSSMVVRREARLHDSQPR